MTEPRRERWRQAGRIGLDLLVLALLLWIAQAYWPRGDSYQGMQLRGMTAPAWGTPADLLMAGPDAGEWAGNALHVFHGRYDQVDPHRMPTWLGLTAAAMHLTDSVVTAGHLVNHCLHVLLVVVLYFLGRAGGGRGVGLMAAALGGLLPHVVADSRTFGIDVLVATAIPGSLLAGLMAARFWPLAALGGALATLASLSHFTTLPYVLPAMVLVAMRGPRSWWRWALAVLGFWGGAALTAWWIYQHVEVPSWTVLSHSLGEGIAPGQSKHMGNQVEQSLALLRDGAAGSLRQAVAVGVSGVRPSWLPWGLAVLAVWLGVVGPGLGRPGPALKRRVQRLWRWCDLGLGLPLLLCLAPLPAMIAVGAPERYQDNLLPVVAVLVARGLCAPLVVAEQQLRQRWSRWPAGLIVIAVGVAALLQSDRDSQAWKQPSMPSQEGMLHARLSGLLMANLPSGSGVATSARAALVMSDMVLCPRAACPLAATEAAFQSCLVTLDKECPGEPDGQLAWVTTDWTQQDPYSLNRQAMSVWIAERWPLTGRVSAHNRSHRLFLIPRADVRGDAVETP